MNIDDISETIVGLKTYEERVTERQVQKYIAFTENHNEPSVNIWAFICGVILLTINIVGKNIKNDYMEEYQIRKVTETFFKMKRPRDVMVDPDDSNYNIMPDGDISPNLKLNAFVKDPNKKADKAKINLRQEIVGLQEMNIINPDVTRHNKEQLKEYFKEDFS